MLSGYNHNISHEGKTFHIQTEDFGRTKSFFLAQVFLGGALVAKERHSYAELTQRDPSDGPTDPIRVRMQAFHTKVIQNLKAGMYDKPPPLQPLGASPSTPPGRMSAEVLEKMILKYFEPQVMIGES